METIKELVPLVIHGSLLLMIFVLGLITKPAEATYLFRHPAQLARAILAINVIVPFTAALVVVVLPLRVEVRLAILLMSVSPLPPLVPGKQLKLGGRVEYLVGVMFAISVLAVAVVPLSVSLLTALFPIQRAIPPRVIASIVGMSFLLPLGAGMAVRAIVPELASRAAPMLLKLANLLVAVAVVPVLITSLPAIAAMAGDGAMLGMAVIGAVALVSGHLLGGPDPHDRAALAVASATRHPGIALALAKLNFDTLSIAPAILLFMLVGLVVTVPYQMWLKRHPSQPDETAAAIGAPRR